uniref:uncharacterized protein LOC124051670 n=1 Tax=Scatophagus argus TaxID=75038 RepID=UPI001ED81776|nr:uncharacterized protein LOC124051670 [Scatophagus argus]
MEDFTAPQEAEGPESVSSRANFTSSAVNVIKGILDEQVKSIGVINKDGILENEHEQLVSSTTQDLHKAISDIQNYIVEEVQSESKAETSCWRKVETKMKYVVVLRYVKQSIVTIVAKLRREFNCSTPAEKTSLQQLFDIAEEMVQDMIPPEEDDNVRKETDDWSLYRKTASDISLDQYQIGNRLVDIVYHHLEPEGNTTQYRDETSKEVYSLVVVTWNWINRKSHMHEIRKGPVHIGLRKLSQELAGLRASTEGPSEKDDDTVTTVSKETPAPLTGESAIGTEADEAAGGATVDNSQELQKLCHLVVTGLISQIMKDDWIHASEHIIDIIGILRERLFAELSDSNIAFEVNDQHIKRIAKAVKKDLIKTTRKQKGNLRLSLLVKNEGLFKDITEGLKEHLMLPKRTSCVKRFFRCVLKTMAKPFTACCRRD